MNFILMSLEQHCYQSLWQCLQGLVTHFRHFPAGGSLKAFASSLPYKMFPLVHLHIQIAVSKLLGPSQKDSCPSQTWRREKTISNNSLLCASLENEMPKDTRPPGAARGKHWCVTLVPYKFTASTNFQFDQNHIESIYAQHMQCING